MRRDFQLLAGRPFSAVFDGSSGFSVRQRCSSKPGIVRRRSRRVLVRDALWSAYRDPEWKARHHWTQPCASPYLVETLQVESEFGGRASVLRPDLRQGDVKVRGPLRNTATPRRGFPKPLSAQHVGTGYECRGACAAARCSDQPRQDPAIRHKCSLRSGARGVNSVS